MAVEQYGVVQMTVLAHLMNGIEATQLELADATGQDNHVLGVVLRRMRQRELVRSKKERGERGLVWSLTHKGESLRRYLIGVLEGRRVS